MTQDTVAHPAAPAPASSLLDSRYRLPALGIVLIVTVLALEAMSVATVMPTVVRALHGSRSYGWAFTGFFLADIVGMVHAGGRTDRRGPKGSLVGGLAVFAAGLLAASAAPTMLVFVLGRALQGLGAGSLFVAVYVLVARTFPAELRARAFGALAAAWVLPALVGPLAAGSVAVAVGWRWVFIGIAPFAALGAALVVPAVAALPPPDHGAEPRRVGPLRGILLVAGLGALQAAGSRPGWTGALLALAGLAVGLPSLRRVLPSGALVLARGLPTVVVLRGVLTGAFFGAEAYLPLTLSRLHHGTPVVVGLPLTVGAVGWSAASWWQGRRERPAGDRGLLRSGFVLVACAVAALAVLADASTPLWVAAPIWALAGAGMGLAMPTLSVLTMHLSPPQEQGANSSALQVTDVLGSVLAIALGASVISAFPSSRFSAALVVIDLALAALALTGALISPRAGAAAGRRGSARGAGRGRVLARHRGST